MLDHRNDTVSARQYSGGPGLWTRESNAFGWRAVLGDAPGEVPAYVSPALATDLSGLPTTYIDAGSAEVFRDEDAAYASRHLGGRRAGRAAYLGRRRARLRRTVSRRARVAGGTAGADRLAQANARRGRLTSSQPQGQHH